jgi:REP element-mobilizing transposase RayT
LTVYFLTFRTHGTWLHGDPRGSQDRYRNKYGSPKIAPDPAWRGEEISRLRNAPQRLDAAMRQVVSQTIREVCAHRHWPLHELNVRSCHVHVILASPDSPEKTMNDLKGWCTRRLREVKLVPDDVSPWSHHGSTVYLFTEARYRAACRYVRDEQGEDLLTMDEILDRYGDPK